jgi:hypothetical protein
MPLLRSAVFLALVMMFPAGVACAPLLGLDDLHDRKSPTDAGPDAEAAADSGDARPECHSNAECIDRDPDHYSSLCVAGHCVAVNQQLCLNDALPTKEILRSDNLFLMAAFVPLKGLYAASPDVRSYTLALEEIESAGGLIGERGAPPRRVGMLLCASDNDVPEESLRHVVEDLKIPSIMAAFGQANLTRFVQNHTVPKGVFTLNPGAGADALKYYDTHQLLWNLLGRPESVALTFRPLLLRTERYLEAYLHKVTPGQLRVALLSTSDVRIQSAMTPTLLNGPLLDDDKGKSDPTRALRFNDRSAAENEAAGRFKLVQVPPPNNEYNTLAETLADFDPDVVVAVTRDEVADLVPAFEKKLQERAGDAGVPRLPMWLLSTQNARQVLPYLESDEVEEAVAKSTRFVGVQYAGAVDQGQRNAWLTRMRLRWGTADEATYAAADNYYDAVYWQAYGLYAAGPNAPINGASLATGVRNLLTGQNKVFPGLPDAVGTALQTISRSTGSVTFVGALGPPDFDKTGTWNSVGAIYCYRTDRRGEAKPVVNIQYDSLRYAPNGELVPVKDEDQDKEFCFGGF